MTVDEHVRALGLVLPQPFRSPTGTLYHSRSGCERLLHPTRQRTDDSRIHT